MDTETEPRPQEAVQRGFNKDFPRQIQRFTHEPNAATRSGGK
jgi:hypothetical protein